MRGAPTEFRAPDRLVQRVTGMFQRLTAGDLDGVLAWFAEDVEMCLPFQPEGGKFTARTTGRLELGAFLATLPRAFEYFAIQPTHAYPLASGQGVVMRYRSDALVRRTGKPYRNSYIGIFEFDASEHITAWTEFHNPLVLVEAFQFDSFGAASP
jgi:uncharacterized protein